MPHVVLNGQTSMETIFGGIKPFSIRTANGIIKASDIFINQQKTAILIESLAIEDSVNRSFLSMVSKRDDGVVVRIYPRGEVEKTPGVKRILAQIAKQILEISAGLKVGETNLSEYMQ